MDKCVKIENGWKLDDKMKWEGLYQGSAHIVSFDGVNFNVSDRQSNVNIVKIGTAAYKLLPSEGGVIMGLSLYNKRLKEYQLALVDTNQTSINNTISTKIVKRKIIKFESLVQQGIINPSPSIPSLVLVGKAKRIY